MLFNFISLSTFEVSNSIIFVFLVFLPSLNVPFVCVFSKLALNTLLGYR